MPSTACWRPGPNTAAGSSSPRPASPAAATSAPISSSTSRSAPSRSRSTGGGERAQAGVPSRGHIRAYQQLDVEIDTLVEQINWRWGTGSWRPIVYEKRHFTQEEMMALHRLAHFCIVSSLHDGMNLVAKEFVSSRVD